MPNRDWQTFKRSDWKQRLYRADFHFLVYVNRVNKRPSCEETLTLVDPQISRSPFIFGVDILQQFPFVQPFEHLAR